MRQNRSGKIAIFMVAVILFMSVASSAFILFGRIISYSETEFVNVLPLLKTDTASGIKLSVKYPDPADPDSEASSGGKADAAGVDSSVPASEGTDPAGADTKPSSEPTAPNKSAADTSASGQSSASNAPSVSEGNGGSANAKHPEFRMEAEAEIFKFSYDNESGKTTVIGAAGNDDKLIAPGTTNLYQFTLQNPGDVALDYTLTMEAYITGTDLRIPVNVRVWDYTNKYLVGSQAEMVDVMELNTVDESAELGAGRYAVYNLEWEWPFESGDDEYDTMLGNLAVDEDLVLHIVIRTVAKYDENPDDPNAGETKPPKTGDSAPILALTLICGFSLLGFIGMIFAFVKSGRKEKEKKAG